MKGFRSTGLLILLIGIVLALVMVVIAAVTGGSASPVSNFFGTVFSPVQTGLSNVANWMGSIYGYINEFDTLKAENAELKKEIARIKEETRDSQQTNEENERLRKLNGFSQKHRDFKMESALVIARNTSNWASTMEIGRGQLHGFAPGMIVINEEGLLVGRITEVGLNWSVVTTLIDTDTELGAIVGSSDIPTVAGGDFDLMKSGRLRLSYLPRDTELLTGDTVLTSGSGGVYPKGLVIGEVEQVRTEVTGAAEYAIVTPAVDLDGLEQVFVIKSFDINE